MLPDHQPSLHPRSSWLATLAAPLALLASCCRLPLSDSEAGAAPTTLAPMAAAPTAPGTILGVTETVEVKEYSISGRTAAELRAQMNRLGPTDRDGKHDARTDWYVRWSYPFDQSAKGCGTGPVKVTLSTVFSYPTWSPAADAAPGLANRWRAYRTALETHERGHADHGRNAAREVAEALRQIPVAASCPVTDAAANARGNAILDRYRSLDQQYDTTTHHGQTQGATFP